MTKDFKYLHQQVGTSITEPRSLPELSQKKQNVTEGFWKRGGRVHIPTFRIIDEVNAPVIERGNVNPEVQSRVLRERCQVLK